MNTNRNNMLALRRHTIRTLTPSELRIANGGCGPTFSCQTQDPQPRHGPNVDVKHK